MSEADFRPPRDMKDAAGRVPDGTIIGGKYEILGYVAAGGMGFIYQSRDLTTNQVVAVKLMREQLRRDQLAEKRFIREAQTVSRLDHPNTIKLLDFGANEADGLLYIAMEWLEGMDLAEILFTKGALSVLETGKVATQVAQALAEAHLKGIVHRDLKPENIFIVDDGSDVGVVKVLDFGIAKIVIGPAETQITRIGMVCGTPEFMAPEQARGEELDGRADIYALGCVIYTILANQVPFTSDNPVGIVMKHQLEPFPELPPHVPDSLKAIVAKATQKAKKDRYKSAQLMADALESFVRTHTPIKGVIEEATVVDLRISALPGMGEDAGLLPSPSRIELNSGIESNVAVTARMAAPKHVASATSMIPQTQASKPGRTSRSKLYLLIAAIAAVISLILLLVLGLELLNKPKLEAKDETTAETVPAGPTTDEPEVVDPIVTDLGSLSIETVPAGATIIDANGLVLGTTPYEVTLDEALDEVYTFTLEGYQPVKRVIQVAPGEMKLETVALVRKDTVSCLFETVPPGATLSGEEGNELGVSPVELEVPLRSELKLIATMEGYKPLRAKLIGRDNCSMKVSLRAEE